MDLKSFASAQQYFSRRSFMRSAGIASAAVAAMPSFAQQVAAPGQAAGASAAQGGYRRRDGGAGQRFHFHAGARMRLRATPNAD